MAYHPVENHLIQIEPSIDPHPWGKREVRFQKKFGDRKEIHHPRDLPLAASQQEVRAVGRDFGEARRITRESLGGRSFPSGSLCQRISQDIMAVGKGRLIPEQFPLLRTMQFTMRWVKSGKIETEEDAEQGNAADCGQTTAKRAAGHNG